MESARCTERALNPPCLLICHSMGFTLKTVGASPFRPLSVSEFTVKSSIALICVPTQPLLLYAPCQGRATPDTGLRLLLDPGPFSPSTPPPLAHTYTQQGNGFFPQDAKTLPRQKDGTRARSSFQPSLKGRSTSLDPSLRGQGLGGSDRKTPTHTKPQRRLSPGDCSTESTPASDVEIPV